MSNTNGNGGTSVETPGATTETPEPATAMVVSREATLASYQRGLEPRDLSDAFKLATILSETKFCGLTSPADALGRIMAGRELGLTAMQSIVAVFVIEDKHGNRKPGVYAEVLEALCIQHPDCEKWEWLERTDSAAELVVKRRGRKEERVRWTLDDARRAGLMDRGEKVEGQSMNNWNKYPRRMLTARCRSEASGLMFPDVTHGFKSREELQDHPDDSRPTTPEPTPAALVAAQHAQQELADALKAKIASATTADARKAVRAEIEAADKSGQLTGAFFAEVKEAYNASGKRKSPPATTAPPAQQSLAPADDRGDDPNKY